MSNCVTCGHREGQHHMMVYPDCAQKDCRCRWFDDGQMVGGKGIDPILTRAIERAEAAEQKVAEVEKERNAFHTTCGELLQATIEADGSITWSKLECKNCTEVEERASRYKEALDSAVRIAAKGYDRVPGEIKGDLRYVCENAKAALKKGTENVE